MALRRKAGRGHELFPGFTDVVEIGTGSLAVVFRARESGTQRMVALKLLNVRDASPRAIESFERESAALGALSSHPNIVTLFRNFRTPDGRPALVLELCSGSVADRLYLGDRLSVPDAVAIGIKIAGALETAHRGGILHRDVKPQNILVTEFGEPALADFGVAMLQSATQTTAGLFDFTTLHAAPELLEGGGTSAATDVYELASSLYQLIAGHSAFRTYEGESPASVILRILRDPVHRLSGKDVPVRLSDLIIRAMSKDRAQRPPTAAEFAAELAQVEIEQGWPGTQFLIRDTAPGQHAPAVTRMPDEVPRGLPSALGALSPESRPHGPPQPPGGRPASIQHPPPDPPGWAASPAAWGPATQHAFATPVREVQDQDQDQDQAQDQAQDQHEAGAAATYPAHPADSDAPVDSNGASAWGETVVPEDSEPATEEPAAEPVNGATAADPPAPRPTGSFPSWWAPLTAGQQPPAEPFPIAPAERSRDAYPYAPTPAAGDTPHPGVPVWATRTPPQQPTGRPTFVGDLAYDLSLLRPSETVRSGTHRLTADEHGLTLRRTMHTERLSWSQVQGFAPHFPNGDDSPRSPGVLVALTPAGAVELRATKRAGSELRDLHARLEAHRLRALARAAR